MAITNRKAPGAATPGAEGENMVGRTMLSKSDSTTDSSADLKRACSNIKSAMRWADENPAAFSYSIGRVMASVAEGRMFSLQEIAEQVRWLDFTDAHGRKTVIDNNLIPALARLIASRVPGAIQLMESRSTHYDKAMAELEDLIAAWGGGRDA